MINNLWSIVHFYCINGHTNPVLMDVKEGNDKFFACPRYMLRDEKHPNGHKPEKPGCANHISFGEAEKIVSMLSERIEEAMQEMDFRDFTGDTFHYRMIDVKVLKYSDDEIQLGVINRKAVMIAPTGR